MAPTAIAANPFPLIRNYKITEQLYAGKRTAVYRAMPAGQQQPVVIKVLQSAHTNFSSLVQFRNQYAISKDLPVPGIVRSLSLEPWQNSYALVMEDFSGLSLQQYVQGRSLPIAETLAIALQIADILHDLAQQRVVHKDIKPANILIETASKKVKLIDFSIASRLTQETSEIRDPNGLTGTLAYLAPEQTGRMNRSIDYRTDFYGLGVTLYELLTGRLPFQSEDPMELVHCHIAQSPVPPDKVAPSIPPMVSAIVLKLMAKNAEDRYQSAQGLKHDLAQCLTQWQQAETIAEFELGGRDRSDRFSTPEKLYGREAEVQTLLEAAMRIASPPTPESAGRSSEMLLVAGFSGIGKTVVINEVHKPITQQRGYFIKGKFDQFNRNLPLSAFVQALQDLSGQLLTESDAKLAEWRAQISTAVGESGQVLIDIIPELEEVIGQQPPAAVLSGAAVQNRFRLLLQKFMAVFATTEHPLVIFLDDLQWADSDSLQLIKLLLANQDHLLVIGAYRDNEVSPTHPFMIAVDELAQAGIPIHTITLKPLPPAQVNQLVADTLGCPAEVAQPLTEWVHQRTEGNPFFTKQFLQGLHRDGHISFDYTAGAWQCNIAQIKALALTDDVVEFMAAQLQKLPVKTQETLKLAACIGAQFDLSTLAAILQQSQAETASALWPALQEGLILSISENYKFFQAVHADHTESAQPDIAVPYRFLHDRVQQAAYSLIPPDQKQETHYRIGQRLLKETPLAVREETIFEIVNQLNHGITLIDDPKERHDLAQLNLIACQRAKNAVAYQSAREYAGVGRSLLGENAWQQQQYETSLALYTTAAEIASLCGDFVALDDFIAQVVEHARSPIEKASAYRIKIQSNAFQNKLTAAIDTALQILQQMGISFPQVPTEEDIQQAMLEIGQLIGEREVESLVDLPIMTDQEKIAIVQLASSVTPAAYISGSPLFPLLVALSVKLSIQYGNTPASAYAYASYGVIACNLLQDIETGTRFGQLALQVVSKLNAKAFQAEVSMVGGVFIFPRKSHIRETLPLLKEGYLVALEVGNLEYVGYSAYNFCFGAFLCGQPLSSLEPEVRAYHDTLTQLSQLTTATYCQIYWQYISSLLAGEPSPDSSGERLQTAEFLPQLTAANDSMGIFYFSLYRLMLGYLFEDLALAESEAITARCYLVAATGLVSEPVFYFYDSLSALAATDLQIEELSATLTRVAQNQAQLEQHWANHAPMNYQHKVDLIAAEKCRVLGEKAEAIELYDRAITGARANRFIQEEALANELCAKFFLTWGKEKVAAAYMQDAYICYIRWEAQAKVVDLERRYPQLLAAVAQSAAASIPDQATITPTLTSSSTTSSSLHLDFLAITKAAQAISQEIELEKLLATLMQTVIASAGAQSGYLILRQAGRWQVVAQADKTCVTPVDTLVEQSNDIPQSLIYSVARTHKTAVFENLGMAPQFESDRYVSRCQPKSALCTPVSRQGKLVGVLYLENNLIEGAFTGDRIEILQLLTSQAAISIENARLYQQTENYSQSLEAEVAQKTQALNQKVKDLKETLKKLKAAQAQIVQTEKMSSLGQLVAGIAHEINNPVNFIHGNIKHLEDYTQDLVKLINAYQHEQPQPSESLQNLLEEIDLDFLVKDAKELLKSLKNGSDRIKEIVLSLRNFSRLDEADLKQVNVHDGIESTLVILQHRLKAAPEHSAISIERNYGDLSLVECYPGQLNQVLMNLLSNAIDTLIEHPTGQKTIRIETKMPNDEWIAIHVIDSGKGIPEAVRSRIFDPFFTTKPVGKGTGLGLSISYQIVTEKHGGRLYCHSTPDQGTEFVIELPVHPEVKST